MFVELDEPSGLDPVRVGSKAAALAAARSAGAPVLGGFVVDTDASRGHLTLGADALRSRGSGGARLAITGRPISFADELAERGGRLGDRVVARSSTLLEASGEWSGAFSSYLDLEPGELPKAVVGCWSSAFTVAALERQAAAGVTPGTWPMAVLIQRALEPEMGGWAELATDGTITVTGVDGSPVSLLQGWASGQVARREDVWRGGLVDSLGEGNLDTLSEALGIAATAIGATKCEWALDGQIWLLQVGTTPASTPTGASRLDLAVSGELVEVARSVVQAPGVLGEEFVLPWGLAGLGHVEIVDTALGTNPLRLVARLCRELTEEVWGQPWQTARPAAASLMSDLRGGDVDGSIRTLRNLGRADSRRAAVLLGTLEALRLRMVELGMVADAADAWHLGPDQIEAALEGRRRTVPNRLGMGQWEPLVAHVVLSAGKRRRGTPASPGLGAGRRVEPGGPSARSATRRAVLTAGQPLPVLASLLWDASGVVTATGSPAAHLFEAARALRVPAVCGVDIGDAGAAIVAVDGDSGDVATMALDAET